MAKTFSDQPLDPIASYRKAYAFLRNSQPQSSMRTAIVTNQHGEISITRATRRGKHVIELVTVEQTVITGKHQILNCANTDSRIITGVRSTT